MLFMVTGHLKSGSEKRLIDFSDDFNEHVSHPQIVTAGALRGSDGRRTGYVAFVETESISEAEEFLRESPFYRAGLYKRCEVTRFDVQIGKLATD